MFHTGPHHNHISILGEWVQLNPHDDDPSPKQTSPDLGEVNVKVQVMHAGRTVFRAAALQSEGGDGG